MLIYRIAEYCSEGRGTWGGMWTWLCCVRHHLQLDVADDDDDDRWSGGGV